MDIDENRWIRRSLCAWVHFVQSHAKGVLAASLALAVLSLFLAVFKLGFKTNRSDLVDPNAPSSKSWARYEKEFGDDMDIVVVVEGDDRTKIIQGIETLARDIASCPDCFEKLCHRIDISKIKAKGLFQLSMEDLNTIQDRMKLMQPLLFAGWNFMTVENLLKATKFRASLLPADKPIDENSREILQTTASMLDSLSNNLSRPDIYRSPWANLVSIRPDPRLAEIPEYFFSTDGKLAFLRVIPKKDRTSFVGYGKPVAMMRKIVACNQALFQDLQFGVTGLPVLEDDEMQASQSASTWSLFVSVAGVCFLFIAGFRTLRHPLFGMASLLVAGCFSLGWITITVGHLNILSVSFLVTLVGMGIDYGICWLSRYEANRALGMDREASNAFTASTVGAGIITGAVTTACAFFATMCTGFRGLFELGFIGGCGILICLLCMFTVLPAMLKVFGSNRMRQLKYCRDNDPILGSVSKYPGYIVAATVIILIAAAISAPFVKSDYNLLNLQSNDLASVKLEMKLIERTGMSGWYLVTMADSPEQAIARRKEFEKLPTVGRVVELASIIPTDQDQKKPIITKIHNGLGKLPTTQEVVAGPSVGVASLRGLLTDLVNFRKPEKISDRILFDRIATLATSCLDELTRLGEADLQDRLNEFQKLWKLDLVGQLRKLRDSSTPIPVTIDDIPDSLRPRYLSDNGKWMLQIFAKSNIWDVAPLQEFTNEVLAIDPEATGKPLTGLVSVTQMSDGYKRAGWLSLLVIFIAVALDFRNLRHTLLSLLPVVFGAIVMLGFMAVFGIAFNPANLIALPMVIGAGVGYGVYVIHDYRQSSGEYVLTWRLARAVGLSGMTTVVGFASLLTASHWGMITIGLVLSVGITACLIAAEISLPALLVLITRKQLAAQCNDNECAETSEESHPSVQRAAA